MKLQSHGSYPNISQSKLRFVSNSNVAHPKDAFDWEYLAGSYTNIQTNILDIISAPFLAISEVSNKNEESQEGECRDFDDACDQQTDCTYIIGIFCRKTCGFCKTPTMKTRQILSTQQSTTTTHLLQQRKTTRQLRKQPLLKPRQQKQQ